MSPLNLSPCFIFLLYHLFTSESTISTLTTTETAFNFFARIIVVMIQFVCFGIASGTYLHCISAAGTFNYTRKPRLVSFSVVRNAMVMFLLILNFKPGFRIDQSLVITKLYKETAVRIFVNKQTVNAVIVFNIIHHFITQRCHNIQK